MILENTLRGNVLTHRMDDYVTAYF